MSVDRTILEAERRAGLAAISAHRSALGNDPVDLDDFTDIRLGIEDVITSLRMLSASVEIDFREPLLNSEVTTRAFFAGNL